VSIALLPYQRDFLELLHDWREDPVVRRYNPVEELSLESLHARCAASHSDFADFENAELFFWLLKADEKVIGNISVRNINRRMLTAEIGYGVAAEVRGNGYATEAVCLVTQKAFTESPLRKPNRLCAPGKSGIQTSASKSRVQTGRCSKGALRRERHAGE